MGAVGAEEHDYYDTTFFFFFFLLHQHIAAYGIGVLHIEIYNH
jgi:hypothetical protein